MLSEALPGKGKVPAVTSSEPVRKIREQDQNGPESDALAITAEVGRDYTVFRMVSSWVKEKTSSSARGT